MGGEDAKLITLARDSASGGVKIEDFSMNTACAAGTGSFLDQQANRLHLTIEEFSAIALKSKTPPRVAGRCSVFAKSDMIHLQQIATPNHDIVAGLCFAMARNFKATVGKGKKFPAPVLFLGGVAANLGMRRAFRDVLKVSENDMTVPDHFNTSGAIGAALMAQEQHGPVPAYRGADALAASLSAGEERAASGMDPLTLPRGIMPNPDQDAATGKDGLIEAYLGVDVGSVSTNVVVIDRNLRVLSKRYLPTAGRPIEAVKQGLAEVGDEIGSRVTIIGAGTTGSGRYLTGDMIGADVVRNEITAQATAAAAIDPLVDTIFEIGGQDSKFISLSGRRGGGLRDEQGLRRRYGLVPRRAGRAARHPDQAGVREQGLSGRVALQVRRALHRVHGVGPGPFHEHRVGRGGTDRRPRLLHCPQLPEQGRGREAGRRPHLLPGRRRREQGGRVRLRDRHGKTHHRPAAPRGDRGDRRGHPRHAEREAARARSRAST